jgi:hypothetical protein
MSPFGSGGGASAVAEVVDISATALHRKACNDALTADGTKQFTDLLSIRSAHSLILEHKSDVQLVEQIR